jgi:ABC-2 type transport system ATP-binding protein
MIHAHGLTKHFGKTVAVDGLTFDIRPGVVTGFLGPNGAGKSTTMRMILGLDHPTNGDVTVGGKRYRELAAPMREVGALLDAGAVHGKLTARAHLRWLADAGGLPRTRVGEVLEQVGLTDVADRRAGGFSLGMRQRLGIAGALLGDPATLLFDEPMNGLDPEGIHWIRTLLQRFAAEGRTVVVSSHLMHEMEETADHVLVIGRGKLIADTTTAEFTQRAKGNHVRVVSPDATALTALVERAGGHTAASAGGDAGALAVSGLTAALIGDLAAEHGLRLHELSPQRASLEAAFRELTQDSVEYRPEELAA